MIYVLRHIPNSSPLDGVSSCNISVMQRSANGNVSFVCHCNRDVNRSKKWDVIQWVKNEWECVGVQFCVDLEGPKIGKKKFSEIAMESI